MIAAATDLGAWPRASLHPSTQAPPWKVSIPHRFGDLGNRPMMSAVGAQTAVQRSAEIEVAADDRHPAKRAVEQVGAPTPTDQIACRVADDGAGDRGNDDCPQRASPWEAATPPRITVISPGKTNPTNAEASSAGSANTRASTSQPGSKRMRSGMLPMTPSPKPSTLRFSPDEQIGTAT